MRRTKILNIKDARNGNQQRLNVNAVENTHWHIKQNMKNQRNANNIFNNVMLIQINLKSSKTIIRIKSDNNRVQICAFVAEIKTITVSY